MSFIVVTRNPRNRKLIVLQESDESVSEFLTREGADRAAKHVPAFAAWGHETLELDR